MKPGLVELERHRAGIEALCRKYGVKELRVFGSALRDDWDPERSDFDFAAVFGDRPEDMTWLQQVYGFAADLERVVHRSVDVVEPSERLRPSMKESVENAFSIYHAA